MLYDSAIATMNVDLGIWDRLTRVIFCLLGLAGVLAIIIWYLPVIQQNERMRQELLRLESEIARKEKQSESLENLIYALRTDRATVERIAREKLGYAKPGETVVLFERAPAGVRVR